MMPRKGLLQPDDAQAARWRTDRTAGAIALFVLIAVALGAARLLQSRLGAAPGALLMVSATLGPLVAAVAATSFLSGPRGTRSLLRRAVAWRVPVRWYALGVFGPLAASLLALIAFVAAGGPSPAFAPDHLLLLPQVMTIGLVFALVEELGWRGWLQEHLQRPLDPRVAALAVGGVWAAWHAPLHYVADTVQADLSLPVFVVVVFAVSVLFAALYNASGGSVPVVAVAHVGFNLAIGLPLLALPSGADGYLATCAALATVLAAAIWRRGPGVHLTEAADERAAGW